MKTLHLFLLISCAFFINSGELPGPLKPNRLDQCIRENIRPIWGFDYEEKTVLCGVYNYYYKSKTMNIYKYVWDEQERSHKEEDKRKNLIRLAKTWFKIYAKFHRLEVEGNTYINKIQELIHMRLITDTEKNFFNMSIEVLKTTLLLLYKILPNQEKDAINQQLSQGRGNIFDYEPFKNLINFYKTQLNEISPTLHEVNRDRLVVNLEYTFIEGFEEDEEFKLKTQKALSVPSAPPLEIGENKLPKKRLEQIITTPQEQKQEQNVTTKTSYSKWFWGILAKSAAWFRSSKK